MRQRLLESFNPSTLSKFADVKINPSISPMPAPWNSLHRPPSSAVKRLPPELQFLTWLEESHGR